MNLADRPFDSLIVNLSLSESSDSEGLGFPASELDRTLLRLTATLLGQGARLTFGHDWRDDGVMESVSTFVERYRSTVPELKNVPLVTNLLPWPDKTRLTAKELKALRPSLQVENAGLPTSIKIRVRKDKRYYPAVRAVALTHLRLRLTQFSNARICLGGRMAGHQGRYPGIVEEALLSVEARKPLYLLGLVGGATQVVIDALKGSKNAGSLLRDRLLLDPKVTRWWQQLPAPYNGYGTSLKADVGETFINFGVAGLSKANHLSRSENEKLFNIETVDEAVEIILVGLRRSRGR